MRTSPRGESAGLSGQTHTQISRGDREVFEDLAGDVAFQAAHDLWSVQPFGSTASHVPPVYRLGMEPLEASGNRTDLAGNINQARGIRKVALAFFGVVLMVVGQTYE